MKTYAFIDASNIIYGARNAGFKVDFKKLKDYFIRRYNVSKIFYYAGVDSNNTKQIKFYRKLEAFGYLLKLVPVKIFSNGNKKADVDSRMTFELMRFFSDYNHVIVMTGDGDYYWVLEYLLENKKSISLIAHTRSTAKELKKLFADKFVPIETIRRRIEKVHI